MDRLARKTIWLALSLLMLSGCGAVETQVKKNSPTNQDCLCAARRQAYDDLIQSAHGWLDTETLDRVNRFFNSRIRYASDFETWGRAEYWATPCEVLARRQGDCEDFAVAKFFTLKRIGVDEDKMNLVYCRIAPRAIPHVVLGYTGSPDSDPLILDSVVDDIVPARERSDLTLILGFNSRGLWVFKRGVRHKISTSSKRIRPWKDLGRRMDVEETR